MWMLRVTAFLTTAALWSAGVVWSQDVAARPSAGSVGPTYPPAAAAAGVEGTAVYRAEVAATGKVQSVKVLDVPREGVGFEEAIERAVSTWRFVPASKDGLAVAGTYEGSHDFAPILEGEVVFPVSPEEAWIAARAVITELELEAETLREPEHVLVTRPSRYRAAIFPSKDELALADGVTIEEVQWHVAVAPSFTKARVAIAGVAYLRRGGDSFVMYNEPHLGAWMTARLAARLGQRGIALSAKPARRTQQSPAVARCADRPIDPLVSPEATHESKTVSPVVLSRVAPLYPRRLLERVKEGTVTLQATVTEHGTLEGVQLVSPRNPPREFVTASLAAASLWRFAPATLDECPIRLDVTLQMKFALR